MANAILAFSGPIEQTFKMKKNLQWFMWKAKEKGGAVTHAKKKDHVPDGGAFNCCHYFYSN